MKRLLLLSVAAMLAVSTATGEPRVQTSAPEGEPQARSLKLMVRNKKGKVMPDFGLAAQIKGSGKAETLDRFGNRFFNVTDADTLILVASGNIYEFSVAGLDSLYVVFRNPSRIEGYVAPGRPNGDLLDIGYGTVSRRQNTSSVTTLRMGENEGSTYTDLKNYMQGRVAGVSFTADGQLIIRGINSINSGIEALIVVDGIAMGSFASVNSVLSPNDVASISVLKDAGSTAIYGVRGANGVVLITTKTGTKK